MARKIDSILGDGNCLYRALAKELFSKKMDMSVLEGTYSSSPMSIKSALTPFFPNPWMEDWHLSKAKEGFWGGTAEIVAIASALQVPIWTYCQQPGPAQGLLYDLLFTSVSQQAQGSS